ncbi:hypothetical protein JCM11491_001738, partial [Sporobolomyces phaffii]
CFLDLDRRDDAFAAWVGRMDAAFPMPDVRERDSHEEIKVCTE